MLTAGPPAAALAAGLASPAAPDGLASVDALADGLAASEAPAAVDALAAGLLPVLPVPVVSGLPHAAISKLKTTNSGTSFLRTFIVLPPFVQHLYNFASVATPALATTS
jgi:hypothetical protein